MDSARAMCLPLRMGLCESNFVLLPALIVGSLLMVFSCSIETNEWQFRWLGFDGVHNAVFLSLHPFRTKCPSSLARRAEDCDG